MGLVKFQKVRKYHCPQVSDDLKNGLVWSSAAMPPPKLPPPPDPELWQMLDEQRRAPPPVELQKTLQIVQARAPKKPSLNERGELVGAISKPYHTGLTKSGIGRCTFMLCVRINGEWHIRKCDSFGDTAAVISAQIKQGKKIRVKGTWKISRRNTPQARWVLFVNKATFL